MLRALSTRGCECHGVERKEFPNNPTSKQYQNYQGDIGEIGFDTGFFDVVILCHVLEHFENPVEALLELSRVLRHGWLLVLAVPNSSSLQARLFGADWFHLDLPRHTHHFTPDSLQACLGKTGFTVTSLHTFSLKQNPFGFIQSFENKVLCGHPNVLFSHLKQHARNRDVPSLVISFVLATLLLPIAILEYLISGMFGKGATLVVFAERDQ